ncbi:MAG: fused MFS/spermidine synthase [Sedimentisphaerales bacterium]
MSRTTKKKGPRGAKPIAVNGSGIKWIMLIYFCSGICSLIDEVVWVRLLKLTLGNTVYASSIVVSVFMGGLALGALIMGRHADQVKKRLRLYAILEVCATISALLLPWVLQLVDTLYRWFFVTYQPSPAGLLLMQVIISAAVLLVPSMVMGSTLPLLGRYVTALQNRVGTLVGRLYALNMLGAAGGCFLAGFVLIRMVGVMGALYIAAAINMLVAFGGWMLSRSHDIATATPVKTMPEQKRSTAAEQTPDGRRYLLMLAFFTSGLVSIGYELIWMRSIVFLLKGFTYVFSAVLTIYLLGNVIGAWLGSRLSKRLKLPEVGFGVSLTCLGILGIFYIPWFSIWHSKVSPNIASLFAGLLEVPDVKAMLWPLFHTTFLFLLPAITMGIGFPLALQAWSNYRYKVGRTTGMVYGINTIGAVLGGLVTGFFLIPFMGVQLSIMALALVAIWLGAIMVQVFSARFATAPRLAHLAVIVGLTITALLIPQDLFKRRLVGAQMPHTNLLAVKEGVTTTVSVHQEQGGQTLLLATSGLPVAGDQLRSVQKTLGHLGLLLNKNTRQVLSVGYGAGETAACMSLHNPQHIDGVEISPELVEVALKFFRHINLGEQLHKKVNMIYMDAKNYLHLTEKSYDLIVNDCTDPKKVADNASLYTKEYFQKALEHLNPNGMFASYLPLRSIPVSCIDSIIGTFAEVFPYVTLWFPTTASAEAHDFLYLVGTSQPQVFSLKHIDNELNKKGVRQSTDYINFHNSHYVLSCYLGDKKDLNRYLPKFNLNTDFRPYIEFNTDKLEDLSLKQQWFSFFLAKVRRPDSILQHIDWTELSEDQQQKWKRQYELFYKASTHLLNSRIEQRVITRLWNTTSGLKVMPEHASLIKQEDQDLLTYPQALSTGGVNPYELLMDINNTLKNKPKFGAAWLIKSWVLQAQSAKQRAMTAALKAVEYSPRTAAAHENAGKLYLDRRQFDKATFYYSEATRLMPNVASFQFGLAVAYAGQNKLDEAVSHFRLGLQIQPYNAVIHALLGDTLNQQGKIDEAIREYRRALQINPNLLGIREKLNTMLTQ